MNRILIVLFGALALIAFPVSGSAQTDHTANSKKAGFHLSQSLVVGQETLKPGEYKIQCLLINGEHVLVVTAEDTGREVARVPCRPEALVQKVPMNEIRSVAQPDGTHLLSAVRIKGETVAHRVVVN